MQSALSIGIDNAPVGPAAFVQNGKMLARPVRAHLGASWATANDLPAAQAGIFQTV
jgi:hypothetical protein